MDDIDILERIGRLVDQERELRTSHEQGKHSADDARRMDDLETTLDQCWDLLRQRRARREYGEDPDVAGARPERVVESYQQ
jgi:hypothetical protein